MTSPAVATPSPGQRIAAAACLALAVLWSAIVYWPILGGYFMGDDFGNLFLTINTPQSEYILEAGPGHVQYLPRLSYFLLFRLVGPEPRWYFAQMLVTHLASVAVLFALVRMLTRNEPLAGLTAALWGSLRVNEGTLGWYAVYGQAATTLIVLIVLYRLARAAERGIVTLREACIWVALLLVACVTFGSAMSIAFLFPVVVWLVVPTGALDPRARRLLYSLPVAVPLAYAAEYGLSVALHGRDSKQALFIFSILLHTLVASAAMALHLFRGGITALVYGVVEWPSYDSVTSYVIPLLFLTVLGASFRWLPAQVRRWSAALLLLAASVYVVIALGRSFAVTANPALGGWVLRYQYVSTCLLSVVVALLVSSGLQALGRSRAYAAGLFALWLGVMAPSWWRGDWQINQHADMRAMTDAALKSVQTAVDAAAPDTDAVFVPNDRFQPALATPFEIGGLAGMYSIFGPVRTDRPVRFVETRPEVRALARPGSPLAELLFPPGAGQ